MTDKLLGVRHPFIDEDQTWCIPPEQRIEKMAGILAGVIVLGDDVVRLTSAELPGEFAPDGMY